MGSVGLTVISEVIVGLYAVSLTVLMLYGLHRYWILFLYWRHHKKAKPAEPLPKLSESSLPVVTVQLPLFNERYVAERLIDAVCRLDYPRERLEIQVLDDSTDETVDLVSKKVEEKRNSGFHIHHLRRARRTGFKAGALAWGLKKAAGEFIAVFDADFIPPPEFLMSTLPYFQEANVGMVQTRWSHLNAGYSLLTRLQAVFLDGHFLLEHTARYKSGAFFNFNGTAGVWRRKTIESAGGWNARTLTEDLDLSYRAQLAGWRFVFVPEFACPAELPVDIHAFRTQQNRWTKGALQVARYVLPDLWRAKIPLHTKIEATAHLTANVGYLLTMFVSLMLLPSLLLRKYTFWAGVEWFEIGVFIMMSVSIAFFYAVSQRELYPDWRWRVRDIPALMSFGIGMCVNNAAAVWSGIFGKRSEFVRTPKYDIRNGTDAWKRKAYARHRSDFWIVQILFAAYAAAAFVTAARTNNWAAVPFIGLFLFGFSYVAGLCILHRSRE